VAVAERVRSWAAGVRRTVDATLAEAYPRSVPGRVLHGIWRVTQSSYGYRWLTSDPDPEVVVDLRESRLAGPVIGLLERLASTAPARRLGAGSLRLTAAVARTVRRAPVRVASLAVLAFALATLLTAWPAMDTGARLGRLAVVALCALGLRVDASWEELGESRLGEVVRTMGAPPGGPEQDDSRD